MNERAPRPEPLPDEPESDQELKNQEALEGLVRHMQQTIDDKSIEGTPQQKLFSLSEQSIKD